MAATKVYLSTGSGVTYRICLGEVVLLNVASCGLVSRAGEARMLTRSFDAQSGIIRVRATGQWDPADVDEHFKKLRLMIADVRRKRLPVRVLVDVREASDRSALIEARISSRKKAIYQPGDRIAILTSTFGDKARVCSFLDGADVWAWQSELAAEQWLFMDEVQRTILRPKAG